MAQAQVVFSSEVASNTARVPGDLVGLPFTHRNDRFARSEEHTSELQSRTNLVCRLLLEKKKATKKNKRALAQI